MKKSKTKKSKLLLDDLKEKGNVHTETLEAISGGVLGMGAGASSPSNRIVDGDMPPPR